MKNMKRFTALGLSMAMMASMSTGVFAAGNTTQIGVSGDTEISAQSGDVDVDGWITKDSIIDPSGSQVNPTYTGSEDPWDPTNNTTTNWGDDTTKDTSQLIVTAPAKLSFLVAGDGAAANIQLQSGGYNVTGTIDNQSCYIQEDKDVIPKKVAVKASQTKKTGGKDEFSVVKTLPASVDAGKGAVQGVYLHLGNQSAEFADMKNADLGILPEGQRAEKGTGENKVYAVNPSKTDIFFADSQGTATGVETKFGDGVDKKDMLNSNYTLTMTYTYQK